MEKKEKIVIGIAGTQLSGKTAATAYFVEKFKAKHFRFSRILDQVLEILGLPISRENEQDLATILRADFGEDFLAHALVESVKKSHADVIIVDGYRKVTELEVFRNLDNFKLIYLKTSPEKAYERLQTREEKLHEHHKTFAEFQEAGLHVADKDVRSLEEYADFVLENEGSLEEFHNQLTSAYTKSL